MLKKTEQEENSSQEGDQTFFDLFTTQLAQFDSIYQNTLNPENSQYSLYEDIKLLVELSSGDIRYETFKIMQDNQILKRNAESLQQRYKTHIRHITQDDLQKIVDYVQQNGLNGYLQFEGEGDEKRLNILDQSQLVTPQFEKPLFDKPQVEKPQLEKPQVKQVVHFVDEEGSVRKILKTEAGTEKQNPQQIDRQAISQLKFTMSLLSQWTQLSSKKLLRNLYKCSGNMDTLGHSLQFDDMSSYWSKEEDDLLIKAQKSSEQSRELSESLFLKKKGEDSLIERKLFLNIE